MSVVIQFFKELGPARLALTAAGFIFFIVIFFIYISKMSSKNMVVLYSELDLEDSSRVTQELEGRRIPYELTGGGTIIKVPEDQVLKLRVTLAQDGIPGKGSIVGYEIFDKEESLGSTSFLQNVKMLRALEGELARTIEGFETIKKARVHLVIPKRELFSKERQETRASIVLRMKGSKSLSRGEIDAMSHLIASAVPDLDVKNITIVDTKGKSLKLGSGDDKDNGYISTNNDERKISYELKLKNTIEELLQRTLGSGKVIAQVNAEMHFDRIVSNSETYDPDGAVLRSQQTTEEKERNPLGGEDSVDASVSNNLPGSGGGAGGGGGGNTATLDRSDETKNYEISRTITNKINEVGVVSKLSVAVLVDGNYKNSTVEGVTKSEYTPRTDEELKKIEDLVKVAVGYDEKRSDKVQVLNMPFYNDLSEMDEETTKEWLKEELPAVIQTIVVAAVIILIFVIVIRPIALRAFDIRKAEVDADTALKDEMNSSPASDEANALLNISRQTTTSNSFSRKANDAAEKHPQETLMLLRRWLNDEN